MLKLYELKDLGEYLMNSKETILIIDNSQHHANELRKCLETEGYHVLPIHNNVRQALETIKSEKPDGIVVDTQLSGRPGLDILNFLRPDKGKSELASYTPVVLVVSFYIDERTAMTLSRKGFLYYEESKDYEHQLVLEFFNNMFCSSNAFPHQSNHENKAALKESHTSLTPSTPATDAQIKSLIDKKLAALGFNDKLSSYDDLLECILNKIHSPKKNPKLSELFASTMSKIEYNSAFKSLSRIIDHTWKNSDNFQKNHLFTAFSEKTPSVRDFIYIIADEIKKEFD